MKSSAMVISGCSLYAKATIPIRPNSQDIDTAEKVLPYFNKAIKLLYYRGCVAKSS